MKIQWQTKNIKGKTEINEVVGKGRRERKKQEKRVKAMDDEEKKRTKKGEEY